MIVRQRKNIFRPAVYTIIHFHCVQKKYIQNLYFNIEGMTRRVDEFSAPINGRMEMALCSIIGKVLTLFLFSFAKDSCLRRNDAPGG
jgi:hypothetical protein